MVALTKTTIVLKGFEPDSLGVGGILKIESFNNVFNATLKCVGIKIDNEDEFLLFLATEQFDCVVLPLSTPECLQTEFSLPSISNLTALLFSKRKHTPILVGSLANKTKISRYIDYYVQNYANYTYDDSAQANKLLHGEKHEPASDEKHYGTETATCEQGGGHAKIEYDDEAIAECNYYDSQIREQLNANPPDDGENIQLKQGFERENIDDEQSTISLQDACAYSEHSGKAQENGRDTLQNDDDSCACPLQVQRQPAFFKGISQKLDELFERHPKLDSLCEVIPNSKWIKIDYLSNSHYVVGIIFKDRMPNHIVYGVPGTRHNTPKGFSDYSHFVPTSLYLNQDDGYWCAFQDADSGEIVK